MLYRWLTDVARFPSSGDQAFQDIVRSQPVRATLLLTTYLLRLGCQMRREDCRCADTATTGERLSLLEACTRIAPDSAT